VSGWKRIGIVLLLVIWWGFTATAEAQQPGVLTLACKGTTTWSHGENAEKPQDVSMGIIFNFATGAVAGFDSYSSLVAGFRTTYNATIIAANDVTIAFAGSSDVPFGDSLTGSIDRVTGELNATTTALDQNKKVISTTYYALHCKPTQRMF